MNHTPFWRGLLRTVLTLALSLFLLSLLVFVIAHYAPGDPLRAYFGDRVEKMSVDERAWAEAKLGLDSGHWFGEEGSGFMRMNLACPLSYVKEAMDRLARAVAALRA